MQALALAVSKSTIRLPIVTFKGANNGTVSVAPFATLVILIALLIASSILPFFVSFGVTAPTVLGGAMPLD
jgi:hypothetical protein